MTTDLNLDAIEARAHLRPARGSDVRALVAEVRRLTALVNAKQSWIDGAKVDMAAMEEERAKALAAIALAGEEIERASVEVARAHRALLASNAERDDWRRRYEGLRDAMLRLHHHDGRHGCATCIDPDGFPAPWPCETSVEVARVERAPEGEAMTDPDRNAGRADARAFLALLAVRALHFGEYDEHSDGNRCAECLAEYPCPTIRALDGRAVARVERGETTEPDPLISTERSGCSCLGHTFPGVSHIVACCDQPHIDQRPRAERGE